LKSLSRAWFSWINVDKWGKWFKHVVCAQLLVKEKKRDNIFCLKKEIFEKTDMMFKENRFRHELSLVFNP
jgi:hypothetical protein